MTTPLQLPARTCLREWDACAPGLAWAREHLPRSATLADLWAADIPREGWRGWLAARLLRYAAERLPADLLAECARRKPWAALRYAAERLPADLRAQCARAEPWAALLYAAKRLPADLLAECQRDVDS